jgi:hypothetical protein
VFPFCPEGRIVAELVSVEANDSIDLFDDPFSIITTDDKSFKDKDVTLLEEGVKDALQCFATLLMGGLAEQPGKRAVYVSEPVRSCPTFSLRCL